MGRRFASLMLLLLLVCGMANRVSAKALYPEKIASGGFGATGRECTGEIGPQSLETQWEETESRPWTVSDVCNGPNVYTYVRQNPWSSSDPEGLETKKQLQDQIETYNRSEQAVIDSYKNSDKSDADKNAEIGKVREQYDADRKALQERIGKLEQTARDMAEISGGAASDYEGLDDLHANVQELMRLLDHAESFGVRQDAINFAKGDYAGLAVGVAKGIVVDRALRSVGLLRHLKKAKLHFPSKVNDTLGHIRKHGSPPPGYVGGRTFKNHEGKLPQGGSYKEFDVDPEPAAGQRRNAERIVLDEHSGRAWYTDDHYQSFKEIK